MALIARTKLSLRIFGEDLDPDDVSIPGQPPKPRPTGAWFLQSKLSEDAALDIQIRDLMAKMTDNLAVWRQLTNEFDVDLFWAHSWMW